MTEAFGQLDKPHVVIEPRWLEHQLAAILRLDFWLAHKTRRKPGNSHSLCGVPFNRTQGELIPSRARAILLEVIATCQPVCHNALRGAYADKQSRYSQMIHESNRRTNPLGASTMHGHVWSWLWKYRKCSWRVAVQCHVFWKTSSK